MTSEKDLLATLAVALLTLCAVVAGSPPEPSDYDKMRYRSVGPQVILQKPVRDDGLGSLLLKNLRFRDLADVEAPSPLSNALYWALQKHSIGASDTERQVGPDMEARKVKKRQNVSVSQLAELLHSLKTRGIEDEGVKLQSLRFGK